MVGFRLFAVCNGHKHKGYEGIGSQTGLVTEVCLFAQQLWLRVWWRPIRLTLLGNGHVFASVFGAVVAWRFKIYRVWMPGLSPNFRFRHDLDRSDINRASHLPLQVTGS